MTLIHLVSFHCTAFLACSESAADVNWVSGRWLGAVQRILKCRVEIKGNYTDLI